MEIVPHLHQIPGTLCNLFLLVEPERLTLIDAGLAGTEKAILRYIADLGRSPRDLKHILITHSDGDHVGALAALQAATGARVYASEIEAQAIVKGKPSRELNPVGWQKIALALLSPVVQRVFAVRPTRVDEIVRDGHVLPMLGGTHVIDTNGHTPGHVSYWIPSASVLFVGDSIINRGGGLRGSTGMNNWDQQKSDAAVQRQAALGAQVVCSGHGEVVYDAANKFPQ